MESSWIGDQTSIPCIGRWILNCWTTRGVKERFEFCEWWGKRRDDVEELEGSIFNMSRVWLALCDYFDSGSTVSSSHWKVLLPDGCWWKAVSGPQGNTRFLAAGWSHGKMCHLLGSYTLSSEWVPGPGCWKGDQLQGLAGAESPTRGGENSSASGLPQSTPCGQSPKAAHYNALDNELTILLSIFHPPPCIYWPFPLAWNVPPSASPVFASPLLFIVYDAGSHGHLHDAFFDFCLESAFESLLWAPVTPSL